MTNRFRVSSTLPRRLEELGLRQEAVLRQAGLPIGLFNQDKIQVSTEEFFALYRGIADASNDPAFGLKLGTEERVERYAGEDRSEILDKRERGGPKWTAKMAQSLTASDTPPNSANWNWSAQSGIQSGDASSATLARAALCACRSCPSLDATSAPGETQRLSGAETSATPDAVADRDIHQSPCHSTPAVPQTAWWCHCACSRASSYRTGLFSAAALAASDLTLEFDSFHPRIAPAPCQAGSYTTPPHRSASLGISHPATA